MQLILYSKPGCHLCEGLEEKIRAITAFSIDLEVRDIRTNEAWMRAYEFEIPVICALTATGTEQICPRISPRASVDQVARSLQTFYATIEPRDS
ncbi:MAG: glutaredoxin family protein [Prochlorothrix sp.]|nr:glutaredoxin family protein [Prochlorothrix sp.]